MTMTRRPSTEDHVPPSRSEEAPGIPALLGAFPRPLFVPLGKGEAILGRDGIAAVGHTDSKISSTHARCGATRGAAWIEDCESRNGTFVNGQRLNPRERVELQDGAVVRLATTIFVFRERHRGGPSPQPPLGKLVGPWGLGDLRAAIHHLRPGPSNVLIEGATGVGKELVAPEVARALGRDPQRLGIINVASFPETVFDAQLFGWERGAFSGAVQAGRGIFREYEGGSVFLDEIGELPPSVQPKLLRVLENREVTPIGASRPMRLDLAILGATNRSLEEMVEANDFRADLLARFPIRLSVPPLSDRSEDLYSILETLWERVHGPLDPFRTVVHPEAIERLMLHAWPANVRDLQRFLTGLNEEGGVRLSAVLAFLGDRPPVSAPVLTKDTLVAALRDCSQSAAARKLGVDRGKLRREMKRHGLL